MNFWALKAFMDVQQIMMKHTVLSLCCVFLFSPPPFLSFFTPVVPERSFIPHAWDLGAGGSRGRVSLAYASVSWINATSPRLMKYLNVENLITCSTVITLVKLWHYSHLEFNCGTCPAEGNSYTNTLVWTSAGYATVLTDTLQ